MELQKKMLIGLMFIVGLVLTIFAFKIARNEAYQKGYKCPLLCYTSFEHSADQGIGRPCKKYLSDAGWCGDDADWGPGYVESANVIDCRGCGIDYIAFQNALIGLFVMGVMLMSISATTLGMNCDTGKSDKSVNGMIFVILMLLIGIVTTALVSVIHKNCPEARKDTPILLTLSVLIMVVSLGYLGYSVYNKHL